MVTSIWGQPFIKLNRNDQIVHFVNMKSPMRHSKWSQFNVVSVCNENMFQTNSVRVNRLRGKLYIRDRYRWNIH